MRHNHQSGFVLVISIWLMVILSILSVSMIFLARQANLFVNKKLDSFQIRIELASIVNVSLDSILADAVQHVDSKDEAWYGEQDMSGFVEGSTRVVVVDEDSKLNLNYASKNLLEEFLDVWQERKGSLLTDSDDFVDSILEMREEKKISSLEQLYLSEEIELEDIERLRPYVTVYSQNEQLNINTVSEIVLGALLQSLDVDAFEKNNFIQSWNELQASTEYISDRELEPNKLLNKLELSATVKMNHLINSIAPYLKVDSEVYDLSVKKNGQDILESIFTVNPISEELKVLYWYEFA